MINPCKPDCPYSSTAGCRKCDNPYFLIPVWSLANSWIYNKSTPVEPEFHEALYKDRSEMYTLF